MNDLLKRLREADIETIATRNGEIITIEEIIDNIVWLETTIEGYKNDFINDEIAIDSILRKLKSIEETLAKGAK